VIKPGILLKIAIIHFLLQPEAYANTECSEFNFIVVVVISLCGIDFG
jgi:hypothetical protein